jgi:hypothetical protein
MTAANIVNQAGVVYLEGRRHPDGRPRHQLDRRGAKRLGLRPPAAGRPLPVPMTDPRWPATDGWVKSAQNINGIEIHYVRNSITGAIDDFKFK